MLVHNHIDRYRLPTNHSAYEALLRSLCLTNPNSAADAQRSTQLAWVSRILLKLKHYLQSHHMSAYQLGYSYKERVRLILFDSIGLKPVATS